MIFADGHTFQSILIDPNPQSSSRQSCCSAPSVKGKIFLCEPLRDQIPIITPFEITNVADGRGKMPSCR